MLPLLRFDHHLGGHQSSEDAAVFHAMLASQPTGHHHGAHLSRH
jgi:hypothetical protein